MLRSLLVVVFLLGGLLIPSRAALAEPPAGYPQLTFVPAAEGNYDVGRGGARITAIVIHETEAPYSSVVYWFRRPGSNASAHYLVRAWDGGITQFVAESDRAYHARSANAWTIGIEHEFGVRFGIGHTDVQYRSSAALACAIGHRYGIPLDRDHILGHNELPGNDHRDPGPFWNWTYYMSLVRACAGDAHVSATSIP
ncbi:MAG: N-acetylmuramoyl-L-alanine amidase, partial [Chloroflexi bacterium]